VFLNRSCCTSFHDCLNESPPTSRADGLAPIGQANDPLLDLKQKGLHVLPFPWTWEGYEPRPGPLRSEDRSEVYVVLATVEGEARSVSPWDVGPVSFVKP